jgi:hypothetical protein
MAPAVILRPMTKGANRYSVRLCLWNTFAVHAVPDYSAVLPPKIKSSGGDAVSIPGADRTIPKSLMNPVSLHRITHGAGTGSEGAIMTSDTHILMDKISVLIAGEEITLSLAEALMAGCFIEDAISADDAADSILFAEVSHG